MRAQALRGAGLGTLPARSTWERAACGAPAVVATSICRTESNYRI